MRKTKLRDLADGELFILPGRRAEYSKVSGPNGAGMVRVRRSDGSEVSLSAELDVVPETRATTADILGSWSKL